MAGWISSKLKVAESLLQQIDQQAADTLGKGERSLSADQLEGDEGTGRRVSAPVGAVDAAPRKLQLNKKGPQSSRSQDSRRSPVLDPGRGPKRNAQGRAPETTGLTPAKSPVPAEAAADGDWTELLATAPTPAKSGVALLERQRSVKRAAIPVAGLLRSEERRGRGGVGVGGERKSDASVGERKLSSPQSSADGGKGEEDNRISSGPSGGLLPSDNVASRDDGSDIKGSTEIVHVDASDEGPGAATVSPSGNGDSVSDGIPYLKGEVDGDGCPRKSEERYSTTVGSSAPYSSSESIGRSDSDSDSESSSDSEIEREREERRKRRERINLEKAASLAAEAIKERENFVAKLEGEKQSLEKILEERKKQQAEEASELQTSMMETMEAADLEKQRHNSTRMEAFARLAALESTNAELARSLATAQWNLEIEASRVVELHQEIEDKKLVHEDLKWRMAKFHQKASNKVGTSKGSEYEQEMLEAEYSFISDKILQLKEKAKEIEANIEATRKETLLPTQVEVELKRRLEQLTDHLIQKQAHVETLSSEKAMLLFRIETASKFLEDNGLSSYSASSANDLLMGSKEGTSARIDIETGGWNPSFQHSKTPLSRIRSAESHLWSLLRQMDVIFSAGALFLRRNPRARIWAVVYLLCLHIWVIFVLSSHSQASYNRRSGAVFSLENINKTTGP